MKQHVIQKFRQTVQACKKTEANPQFKRIAALLNYRRPDDCNRACHCLHWPVTSTGRLQQGPTAAAGDNISSRRNRIVCLTAVLHGGKAQAELACRLPARCMFHCRGTTVHNTALISWFTHASVSGFELLVILTYWLLRPGYFTVTCNDSVVFANVTK